MFRTLFMGIVRCHHATGDIAMDNAEIEFYNDAFRHVREQSAGVLETLSRRKNIQVLDIPADADYSYDHWISSIMVRLGPVSIYLKVHFDSKTARELVAGNIKMEKTEIPVKMLIGFIEEYLNVLMGTIKSLYGSKDVEPSTPDSEPSFDTVDLDHGADDMNSEKWQLKWDTGDIALVAYIVVTGSIADLETKEIPKAAAGDIEFL